MLLGFGTTNIGIKANKKMLKQIRCFISYNNIVFF